MSLAKHALKCNLLHLFLIDWYLNTKFRILAQFKINNIGFIHKKAKKMFRFSKGIALNLCKSILKLFFKIPHPLCNLSL